MRSIQELEAIRESTLENKTLRKEHNGTRIVVGMATCGIAAGALVKLGGTEKTFDREGANIRTPGAQDEQSLLSLCIRCDRCRSACPTNAIGVGHLSDGIINARVPVMDFRSGYCDMCGGDFIC